MSSVSTAEENLTSVNDISCESLLEHLYTYYGIDQLRELLSTQPDDEALTTWDVSAEDFKANVQAAIEYVLRD